MTLIKMCQLRLSTILLKSHPHETSTHQIQQTNGNKTLNYMTLQIKGAFWVLIGWLEMVAQATHPFFLFFFSLHSITHLILILHT